MVCARADPVLRELPLAHDDLAAAADPASAAHRVEVHAERASGREQVRPVREPPALAGRGEDDERLRLGAHDAGGASATSAPAPRLPGPAAAAAAAGAGRLLAEPRDPLLAVRVVAHHHVGGHHRGAHLGVQRARDRRRHPRRDRHRQERAVQRVAVRQTEADVGRAARRVHAQLVVQPTNQREHLPSRRAHRADRHHQRVDDDVLLGDPVVGRAAARSSPRPRTARSDPRRCRSRRS